MIKTTTFTAKRAANLVPKNGPPPAVIPMDLSVRPPNEINKLNKTERAFYYVLLARQADGWSDWIGTQNITLKVGDDCRYTPDFLSIESGKLVAYEVKGFMRDDALVKLKTAARQFPWVRIVLVTRDKEGWHYKDIEP